MSKTYRILMWLLTLTAFVIAIDSHVKMTRMSESLAARPDTSVVESIEMPRTITQIVTVTVAAAAAPVVVAQIAASCSSDDALAQLQAELEKTKNALASRESEVTRLQGLLTGTGTNNNRRAFFQARMEARMEIMKTNDPVAYAEMQQQRTNFLQSVQAQAASRSDFLSSVDTSNMSDDQLANHNQLVQLTQRVQSLIAQMPTLPPDQQAAAMQELQQARPTLNTLYQNERTTLLNQTAQAVGYTSPDQQSQFTESIKTIYDQTRTPPGMGGRGGGFGPVGATGTTPAPAATTTK